MLTSTLGVGRFPALPVTRLSRRLLAKAFGVVLAKAGHSSLAHSPVSFARSPRSRKPIQRARDADRSSARVWRKSKSTISLGPTPMASLRYDNRAETRGDNYGSLRRR